MKEKMLNKLSNNFSLKILSVLVAIIFWVVIVNIYDPSIKVTVSGVNVQLLNEDALSNMGYSYEVQDGSKIAVYVSGPRSLVSNISASDIIATVDLSSVTVYSDYVDISVKLQKSGNGYAAVQVAPKTNAIKVNIENRATKTFEIEAGVVNSPAEGYVVGECQISPSTVTITGAQSLINSIGSVRTVVDVNGASEDVATNCILEVYNTDGKIISKDKLDMSRKEIDAKVSIFPVKEILVEVNYSGNVAAGYVVSDVTAVKDKIVIAGDAYVLESISKLELPAEAIDISGLDKDTILEVDISKYLPEELFVVDNEPFEVNVSVEAYSQKLFTISNSNITVKNLSSQQQAEIITENVTIHVSGRDSVLMGVNADNFNAEIDLSNLEEGEHEVEVKISAPNGCNVTGSYRVKVKITNTEQ